MDAPVPECFRAGARMWRKFFARRECGPRNESARGRAAQCNAIATRERRDFCGRLERRYFTKAERNAIQCPQRNDCTREAPARARETRTARGANPERWVHFLGNLSARRLVSSGEVA